ncbi:hypothetical protein LAZ67_23002348 [Cordylochernes scorpioides]|uniref:Uncharacterized protein n=1 Tax=Cordylochernes scorpioides TaxID=51811 RepID=A0ABY6LV98_9ARAC|nr:hypothetical protein LAZ67_23002348 [Cordylochernes scorpioides]
MVRLRDRKTGSVSMSLLRCERRVLRVATGGVTLAIVLWTIAVSTDWWIYVDGPPGGIYINATDSHFYHSRSGLWRVCRVEVPANHGWQRDHTRSAMAFSLISLSLMLMALGFSAYTFKEPRYMFKRLAAGVHFLAACTILVVQEVLINSVKYGKSHLHSLHPPGSIFSYGSSFHMGWCCFTLQLLAGTSFLLCSRKRKADLAPTEELGQQDEPQILGRI